MQGNNYKVRAEAVRQGFASRFRLALADLGYSPNEQSRLQRLFGVSGQAVRKWAEGTSMPTLSRMNEVAAILGVRRAWLQDGEEPMRPTIGVREESGQVHHGIQLTQAEMLLVIRHRQLSQKQRDALDTIIAALAKAGEKSPS